MAKKNSFLICFMFDSLIVGSHLFSLEQKYAQIYDVFFTDRRLYVISDHYSCDDLFMQSIIRRVINISVHLMIASLFVSSIVSGIVTAIVSMNILNPILPQQ